MKTFNIKLVPTSRVRKSVLLNGEEIGLIHKRMESIGNELRGYRKEAFWTGHIIIDGEKLVIKRTSHIFGLATKIELLVRFKGKVDPW
jgi:hypothetical protein